MKSNLAELERLLAHQKSIARVGGVGRFGDFKSGFMAIHALAFLFTLFAVAVFLFTNNPDNGLVAGFIVVGVCCILFFRDPLFFFFLSKGMVSFSFIFRLSLKKILVSLVAATLALIIIAALRIEVPLITALIGFLIGVIAAGLGVSYRRIR